MTDEAAYAAFTTYGAGSWKVMRPGILLACSLVKARGAYEWHYFTCAATRPERSSIVESRPSRVGGPVSGLVARSDLTGEDDGIRATTTCRSLSRRPEHTWPRPGAAASAATWRGADARKRGLPGGRRGRVRGELAAQTGRSPRRHSPIAQGSSRRRRCMKRLSGQPANQPRAAAAPSCRRCINICPRPRSYPS